MDFISGIHFKLHFQNPTHLNKMSYWGRYAFQIQVKNTITPI
jgi:hypothetical protein